MNTGFSNNITSPNINGLVDISADSINSSTVTSTTVSTDSIILNGVDISASLSQIPINTNNITTLQQITTGQTYASVGDTTTFDNNLSLTSGKKLTMGYYQTQTNSQVNNLFLGSKNGSTIFMTYGAGLPSLTTGDYNVIMGGNIGNALQGGSNNFALGYNCFNSNVNGCNNCLMGHRAGLALGSSGNFYTWYNTAIGDTSLTNANDVAESTCIGWGTGNSMLNNNLKCTCIGAGADCADGLFYSTSIGAGVTVTTSNTVQIGRSADNTIFDGTLTLKNNLILTSPATTLTPTELSYLDGVTSNIQTQINAFPAAANTVTTNTNQTITGLKNFEGQIEFSGAGVLNASNITQEFTSSTIYKISNNVNDGKIEFWLNTTTGVSTKLFYLHYPSAIGAGMYLSGYTFYSGNGGATTVGNTSTSNFLIDNGATSGTITFGCRDSVGVSQNALILSASAVTFNNNNITVNAGNINFGSGAGSVSNLICGNTSAKNVVFSSGDNTVLGGTAGNSMTIAAANNTYVGSSAGSSATNSVQNTCIGAGAGKGITSGLGANVFVGYNSGFQTTGTGSNNTCIGTLAGAAMTTTANSNVMVGALAGDGVTTGVRNTLIGAAAGDAITTGNDNTIVGQSAGSVMLIGLRNTFIGTGAGDNSTGSDNICIGSASTVPTAAGNNQISIGTTAETMYIRGGFNWRVGQITTSTDGNLSAAVLCQLYMVAMSAGSQTITLPNPAAAAYIGATVMFKRKTNTTAFTLTQAAGFLNYGNITIAASPYLVPNTIFQVHLVSDGTNWCVVAQR